jgi:hypothetical protein
MGCSHSISHNALQSEIVITISVPHKNVDETLVLTKFDISTIRQDFDWLQDNADLMDVGSRLYQRMFALEPSSRTTFKEFGHLDSDSLVSNSLFQMQVDSYMKSIETIVALIGDIPSLLAYLHSLGVAHRNSAVRYEHVFAMEKAMCDIFERELKPRYNKSRSAVSSAKMKKPKKKVNTPNATALQSAAAWRKLFRLVTSKVFDAYRGVD